MSGGNQPFDEDLGKDADAERIVEDAASEMIDLGFTHKSPPEHEVNLLDTQHDKSVTYENRKGKILFNRPPSEFTQEEQELFFSEAMEALAMAYGEGVDQTFDSELYRKYIEAAEDLPETLEFEYPNLTQVRELHTSSMLMREEEEKIRNIFQQAKQEYNRWREKFKEEAKNEEVLDYDANDLNIHEYVELLARASNERPVLIDEAIDENTAFGLVEPDRINQKKLQEAWSNNPKLEELRTYAENLDKVEAYLSEAIDHEEEQLRSQESDPLLEAVEALTGPYNHGMLDRIATEYNEFTRSMRDKEEYGEDTIHAIRWLLNTYERESGTKKERFRNAIESYKVFKEEM